MTTRASAVHVPLLTLFLLLPGRIFTPVPVSSGSRVRVRDPGLGGRGRIQGHLVAARRSCSHVESPQDPGFGFGSTLPPPKSTNCNFFKFGGCPTLPSLDPWENFWISGKCPNSHPWIRGRMFGSRGGGVLTSVGDTKFASAGFRRFWR